MESVFYNNLKVVFYREEESSMAKTIRIKVTTNVRRTGNGSYVIRTTSSNGASTKTSTKTIRVR